MSEAATLHPQVDVLVEAPGWGDPTALITRAVAAALAHHGLDPAGYEVSVLACDDARIRVLNAEFRGQDKPTNVLSWPATDLAADTPGATPYPPDPGDADDPVPLGDIALALETCQTEATAAGRPLDWHIAHLSVHSVLHLLGYDHDLDADAVLMEARETAILATMGIPDPYGVAPDNRPGGGQTE